jgi:hypothetical protein
MRSELWAAIAALAVCPPQASVAIYTDSQSLVNSFLARLQFSPRRAIRTPCNTEWSAIRSLMKGKGLSVTPHWVRGHSGILGNEEADRLAREGQQSIPLRFSLNLFKFQDLSYSLHFRNNLIGGDPRRFLKRLHAERVTAKFSWRIQHLLVGEELDPHVTKMAVLGGSNNCEPSRPLNVGVTSHSVTSLHRALFQREASSTKGGPIGISHRVVLPVYSFGESLQRTRYITFFRAQHTPTGGNKPTSFFVELFQPN